MSSSLPRRRRAPREDRGPAPGLSLAACRAGGCHHLQCRRAAAAAERLRQPQVAGQLRWLAAMAHSRPYLAGRLGVAPHVVRQAQDGTLHPLPPRFAEAVGRLHRELAGVRGDSPASAAMAARLGWPSSVDATGTCRRLQAMAYQGWTCEVIAEHVPGADAMQLQEIRDGRGPMWIDSRLAAAVSGVYDRLWDVRGGCEDTIHLAMRHGWAPALAWDDDPGDPHWIDDPACPVSSWRRPRLTPLAGRAADIREVMADGYPTQQLAAWRLGIGRAQAGQVLSRDRRASAS